MHTVLQTEENRWRTAEVVHVLPTFHSSSEGGHVFLMRSHRRVGMSVHGEEMWVQQAKIGFIFIYYLYLFILIIIKM